MPSSSLLAGTSGGRRRTTRSPGQITSSASSCSWEPPRTSARPVACSATMPSVPRFGRLRPASSMPDPGTSGTSCCSGSHRRHRHHDRCRHDLFTSSRGVALCTACALARAGDGSRSLCSVWWNSACASTRTSTLGRLRLLRSRSTRPSRAGARSSVRPGSNHAGRRSGHADDPRHACGRGSEAVVLWGNRVRSCRSSGSNC